MMRVLCPVLVFAVLSGPALADSGLERLTRREQLLGWEAVGRIDIRDQGFCTGTLIATDLVLTAAHCVFDPVGRPLDASQMSFRAGYVDGTAIAEAGVSAVVISAGYDPLDKLAANSVRHDAALLQLSSAIPAAQAAPFVVANPAHGSEVSVVSYAEGREEALSWQRSCAVLGRGQGLIAMTCDVTFGASGAPVLDRSAGRARIVSIISAGYRDQTSSVAYGMELEALVGDLKSRLRAGHTLTPTSGQANRPDVRRLGAGNRNRDIGARFVKP